MNDSSENNVAQETYRLEDDKKLQESIKAQNRHDAVIACLCTGAFIFALFTPSFVLGKNLGDMLSVWDHILLSFACLCLVGYTCRQKLHGRAVCGGMENASAIAFGSFFIFLGGSLTGLHQHTPFEYAVMMSILSATSLLIGTILSFLGFKEGPTYGWFSYFHN